MTHFNHAIDFASLRETYDLPIADDTPKNVVSLTENEIAKIAVNASFHIHTKLGPGLLESVYERILARELTKRGLSVTRQVVVPIVWDGERFDEGFRADLIVNDLVILELKSVEQIAKVHKKQLLTYLRLTDKRLGLLINFGANLMKEGLFRVVNGLVE